MDYIDAEEATGRLRVIRPSVALPIGRLCHDPALMHKVYDLGLKVYDLGLAAYASACQGM